MQVKWGDWGFIAIALALFYVETCPAQKQGVVFQDLTFDKDARVASFSDHAVVLSDERIFGWHEILEASVAEERQKEFDLRLKSFGRDLFRFHHRLRVGDRLGATRAAIHLFETESPKWRHDSQNEKVHLHNEGSKNQQSLTLAQQAAIEDLRNDQRLLIASAAMAGWMAQGKRERAAVAFLVAHDSLRFGSKDAQSESRRLVRSVLNEDWFGADSFELGFHPSLHPVWFSSNDVAWANSILVSFFEIDLKKIEVADPASRLYALSLLASGTEVGQARLEDIRSNLLQCLSAGAAGTESNESYLEFQNGCAQCTWLVGDSAWVTRMRLLIGSDLPPRVVKVHFRNG